MSKTYLRYVPSDTFGLICTSGSNALVDASGRLAICPTLHDITLWNIKQGTIVHILKLAEQSNDEARATLPTVTVMSMSPNEASLAAGYSDGSLRIWNVSSGQCEVTFKGHNTAVTALAYNVDGSLLASGGRDTDVVVWDPLSENGLYRLRGHKGDITDLKFLTRQKYIISSSKDSYLRIWDLDTQHCIETVVGHHNEVWSFDVNREEDRIVTGSSDNEVRIFKLQLDLSPVSALVDEEQKERMVELFGSLPRVSKQRVVSVRFEPFRSSLVAVQSADKVIQFLRFRSPEAAERKRKRREKRRKEKETGADTMDEEVTLSAEDEVCDMSTIRLNAKVRSFSFLGHQIPTEPNHTTNYHPSEFSTQVLISLHNNSVCMVNMTVSCAAAEMDEKDQSKQKNKKQKKKKSKDSDWSVTYSKPHYILRGGHRSAVRSVCFSEDSSLALSSCKHSINVWNANTKTCIRTLSTSKTHTASTKDEESSNATILCAVFAPGSRHIISGSKEGYLDIWDVSSGVLLRRLQGHDGPIWNITMRPDNKGILTGSGDKSARFWEFELLAVKEEGAKRAHRELNLVHTRTLKLTDDVLCCKYSPDGKYVCVGLLDSTIKVFHSDTLKFFLSLYGHKLPVLSIDISQDSTLLVSGSADKSIKVWGLDFGDCHHSFRAHDESVMQVKFISNTHYIFSCSKDFTIKHWDCDRFEHILTLKGHASEVWGMDVNSEGTRVVTSSNDLSIRMWDQTDEQVFLEEEREKELEELYDEAPNTQIGGIGKRVGSGIEADVSTQVHTNASALQSQEGMKNTEKLMSAIDLADEEKARYEAYEDSRRERQKLLGKGKDKGGKKKRKLQALFKDDDESEDEELMQMMQEEEEQDDAMDGSEQDQGRPVPNPYLLGMTPEQFVLKTFRSIRHSHLEACLLTLPFSYASRLLTYLSLFLSVDGTHSREMGISCVRDAEVLTRALLFLVSVHQKQITSNEVLTDTLITARNASRVKLLEQRERIGVNMAGIKFIKKTIDDAKNAFHFGE